MLAVNPQPEQSSQGQDAARGDAAGEARAKPMFWLRPIPGARVRLTLRNPLDEETRTRAPLSLGAVMRSRRRVDRPKRADEGDSGRSAESHQGTPC